MKTLTTLNQNVLNSCLISTLCIILNAISIAQISKTINSSEQSTNELGKYTLNDDKTVSSNVHIENGLFHRTGTNRYSTVMLNTLFSNLISDIAFSQEALSTSRLYASVSNDNNTFSFGANFNFNNSPLTKTTWMSSVGIESSSKNKFASFFKNGKIENEIFLNAKISRIGNGIIWFNEHKADVYTEYREKHLIPSYQRKLHADTLDKGEVTINISGTSFLGYDEDSLRKELISSKIEEYNIKLAKDGAEIIEKEKLYNLMWDNVLTFNVKLPLSYTVFNVSPKLGASDFTEREQFLFEGSLNWTQIFKHKNKCRLYLTPRLKVWNSNNIITDQLNSGNYLTFTEQGASNLVVTDENKVYHGEFKEYLIGSASGELIFFPWNNIAGITFSGEYAFMGYEMLNWKMGIPLSLKDKEGKPTVNIQPEWREFNKEHFVGVSIGFVIGNFVF